MLLMTLLATSYNLLHLSVGIGLFGVLAKFSELILDSHQQAQFQNFMGKTTEHLIDLNVVKWYPRLREFTFNTPIFIVIVGVEWLILARFAHDPKIMQNARQLHAGGWRPYVSLGAWQFVMYLVIVNWLARIGRAWRFCVSTLIPGILAVPFVVFAFFALFGWIAFVGAVYKSDPQTLNPTLFKFMFFGFLGILAVAVLWFWLAGVLFVMGFIVSSIWFMVSFLRGLFWRITTYAKGAWAAFWIVITGILSLIDLLLTNKVI
jgi:hypothetical protein